jgi:cytochrome-b5 reductase
MTTNVFLRSPRAAAFSALAVTGLGIGFALLRNSPSTPAPAEPPKSVPVDLAEPASPQNNMSRATAPSRVFSSGLSMVSLRLKSSEDVTHNVKRLRFEFPNPDAVSGLSPSCEFPASKTSHSPER